MVEHLHILHLPKRIDRLNHLMKQLEEQKITSYSIIEGEIDLAAVFRGINNSHKNIVRLARQQGMPMVTIAEDDILFTSKGAWQYYLDNMPKEFDLYLASYYEGKVDTSNRLIKGTHAKDMLAGLTLYTVSSRFYDVFLSVNPMSHLDKSLGEMANQYEYYVCPEFAAIQMNGYSDQKKKVCNYDRYLKGRKLFGVNQ